MCHRTTQYSLVRELQLEAVGHDVLVDERVMGEGGGCGCGGCVTVATFRMAASVRCSEEFLLEGAVEDQRQRHHNVLKAAMCPSLR